MRWRRAPKQSCPTDSRNSATALLLGQSVTLDISCVHGLSDILVSNSCLLVRCCPNDFEMVPIDPIIIIIIIIGFLRALCTECINRVLDAVVYTHV